MAFPSITKSFHHTSYPSISPSRPELSTKGRTILITGGGSGIGPVIVESYARAGSTKIAILGRTSASLQSTKTSLEPLYPGLTILPLVADITDISAVHAAFAAAKKEFGPIDVLVSNAAYMPDKSAVASADPVEWWRGMEVNVKGGFNLAQAFLATKSSSSPTIISFTTGPALFPGAPIVDWSGYIVSKVAAVKLMDFVASENSDVRVHQIHPGVLNETAMGKKGIEGGLDFPSDDMSLAAGVAVWSASSEAAFMSGRVLWCNWDIDELKERKEELLKDPTMFQLGQLGWP